MKYSIIIQCYNGEEELHQLLNTIPDREDIEIIIIDDNSFSPIQIQKIYLKTQCLLFRNNKNSGYGYNRQKGLYLASGKYIIFMDSNHLFFSDAFDLYDKYSQEHDLIISSAIEMSNGRNQDEINCLHGACCKRSLFNLKETSEIHKCSYFEDTILCSYLISKSRNLIFQNGFWSEPGDRARSTKSFVHEYTYDYLEFLMMSFMYKPYMRQDMRNEATYKILHNSLNRYPFAENEYLITYYKTLFDKNIYIDKQLYYYCLKNFFFNILQGEKERILNTVDEYLKCVL